MPLQFYLKSIVHEIVNICFTEYKHVYRVVLEGSDVVTASVFVSTHSPCVCSWSVNFHQLIGWGLD